MENNGFKLVISTTSRAELTKPGVILDGETMRRPRRTNIHGERVSSSIRRTKMHLKRRL